MALEVVDEEIRDLLTPLLEAAAADPGDAEGRGKLAMALEVNGFAEAALESYRHAASLAPQDPRWPYYEALLLAHRGQIEPAIRLISRSLELDPGHAPAWLWRGTWLLDLNRVEQAAAAFEEARSLGVDMPAKVGLARVMLRRGDALGTVETIAPLIEAQPHPYLYKLLGEAHRRLGDTEQARVAFGQVRDSGPLGWDDSRSAAKKVYEASLAARIARVRAFLAEGRTAEALQLAEALDRRHAGHQGLLTVLSEIYRRLGRREREYQTLVQALDLYPDFYSFHLKLAEYHIVGNDGDRARHHLDRALELNPNVGWAHAQRGLLLLEQDRLDEALESFEAALGLDPQAAVYYYAGMTEASRRNWSAAIGHFSDATSADPSFALAHVGLGRALAETGRFDEARAAFGRAGAAGTHASEVDAALTWLERRLEKRQ